MLSLTASGLFSIFGYAMNVVWVALIVLFLIIEAATAGLTTIWFATGALAALVASLFGAAVWLQIVWFIVVSAAALYFTRPLVKKYVNSRVQPTNADMVIGKEGVVTEDIDNLAGTGAVTVGGKVWTARSTGPNDVAKDSLVVIERIEGVKLMVRPTGSTNE